MKDIYSFPANFEFHNNELKGECGVYFYDLPGMTSAGDNLDDARKNVKEGLAMHLELMLEHKEHIPEPTLIKNIPQKDNEIVELVTITREDIVKIYRYFNQDKGVKSPPQI